MSKETSSKKSGGLLPAVGRIAIPLWLIVLTGMLGWRGCMYVDYTAGGLTFNPKIYRPYTSTELLENLQPKGDSLAPLGKQLYSNNCAQCHGASGAGNPGQAPPVAGSEWVVTESPERLVSILLHAVGGPLEVKGEQWNLFSMPAWKDALDDREIAAIATYMRQESNWGNDASAVTPEYVAEIREKTSGRSSYFTQDELLAIPAE